MTSTLQSPVPGHQSRVTSHQSPVTSHESRVTSHESRVTSHESRVTSHESPVTSHESRVTSHAPPITGRGYFVTGTDTGVGKTLVACALLHAYGRLGFRAIGMKPVAAGAQVRAGKPENDDVTKLKSAGNAVAPDELVNPYCFVPAIAPHLAAAHVGVTIEIERIRNAFLALAAVADRVIVEGAGGYRVPLGREVDTAHLAVALGLPVILVVAMRLGCLNHALLTAEAVRSSGLTLAGWVANHVDPIMPHADENIAALAERLCAPLLVRIAHREACDPVVVARALREDLLQ